MIDIEKIFQLTDTVLKDVLYDELIANGYDKSKMHSKAKFLYAEGNAPYMLVAHLDTVHQKLPSIICKSKNGYMMSPQGIGGDDRCGVYIILSLLNRLSFKPYVLFTMDEEIGGHGASAFNAYIKDNKPSLKYIVEYDRKGSNDCVFYNCDNKEFIAHVEKFGFKTAYGTFTDISIIAPYLGVAAVNISCGYYNPHMTHEYVSVRDMLNIIGMSTKMLTSECGEFKYVKKEYKPVARNTYKHRGSVKVSFLPANTIYSYGRVMNHGKEIAVDADGNLYRYNSYYGDLYVMPYADLKDAYLYYDEANSEVIPVF